MNYKDKAWFQHAESILIRIKEFRQQSPLGYYSTPDEYMSTVEDFIKLFYEINDVPKPTLETFIKTMRAFEDFKKHLYDLCDILLERAKQKSDKDS